MIRLGVYTLLYLGILHIVDAAKDFREPIFIGLVTAYGGTILVLCLLYVTVIKPYFKSKLLPTSGTSSGTLNHIWYTSNNPVPSYWNTKKGYPQVVNISKEDAYAIKRLVYTLWQEAEAGLGRDASSTKRKFIKVRKIQRIENCALFDKYDVHRKTMERKEYHIGEFSAPHRLTSPIKTTLFCEQFDHTSVLETDINHNLNEHYLFHGTKPEQVVSICNGGLQIKQASQGLFGTGTYFAEDPTKSDQYAGDSDVNRTIILLRVCLGELFIEKNTVEANLLDSPPCRTCYRRNCVNHPFRFDSVVADVNNFRFREFVVYRDHRSYPEYIITYDRVADDTDMKPYRALSRAR